MISESFQSIINPQNIQEDFIVIKEKFETCPTEITAPTLQIGASCLNNKKNSGTFSEMREELLDKYIAEFDKIDNSCSDNEDQMKENNISLMLKLLENVKQIADNNKEKRAKMTRKEGEKLENQKFIEDKEESIRDNKNDFLISDANLKGVEESKNRTRTIYFVIISLIVLFLVIEGVLFFI